MSEKTEDEMCAVREVRLRDRESNGYKTPLSCSMRSVAFKNSTNHKTTGLSTNELEC